MGAVLAAVRSGDWVTPERIRLWSCAALIATAAGLGYLLVSAHGIIDAYGRPLGTDFSNVYAAGTYVLEGHAAAPFHPVLQYAREQALFGAETPFYGWHYPPFFLLIAAPLALLPYAAALAVWQGVTLALYLFSIGLILRSAGGGGASPAGTHKPRLTGTDVADGRRWLLVAAAYPAVFVNLGHGHNGFLTAALLGMALALLDRRPLLAGILIGCLAYKPQFGLLIPLVLVVTGRWRPFAAAAATVAALALVVTALFGIEVWTAFAVSTSFTRTVVLEAGNTGWEKIQSVFAAVRMWGGGVPLAYALQAAVLVLLAGLLVRLWRSAAAYPLKAAALIVGSVLATPYALDYDLMVLAPALAFLTAEGLQRGFAPYEKSLLAAVWLVPLIARSVAAHSLIPLGTLSMLALIAVIFATAEGQRGGAPSPQAVSPAEAA